MSELSLSSRVIGRADFPFYFILFPHNLFSAMPSTSGGKTLSRGRSVGPERRRRRRRRRSPRSRRPPTGCTPRSRRRSSSSRRSCFGSWQTRCKRPAEGQSCCQTFSESCLDIKMSVLASVKIFLRTRVHKHLPSSFLKWKF